MALIAESELSLPVKRFLEAAGYTVKTEVQTCDLVAVRGDEPPVVVELKARLNLTLLLQAVDRLAVADTVYIAVPGKPGGEAGPYDRRVRKLCRLIGLGLIAVEFRTGAPTIHVLEEPGPYQPRKDAKRRRKLLREFTLRRGDPNQGGVTGVKLVTAYRQAALRLALYLNAGPASPKALAQATGVTGAAAILQRNVYGWFERVDRGVYQVTDAGRRALDAFAGSY